MSANVPGWGKACWEIANSDQYWPSPDRYGYSMYCHVCGEETLSVTVPQVVIDETLDTIEMIDVLTLSDWCDYGHDDECISQCPYGPEEKCRIGHGCTYCSEEQL